MLSVKKWLAGMLALTLVILVTVAGVIIYVDPYFHYHGPQAGLYYELNNERSQNDGIIRHFSYDGMIIGTSMSENFKASEAEELWGGTFIKVPFAGGTYKEQNDNIAKAIKYNPDLKIVIRPLDYAYLMDDPERVRDDLGDYPDYLYDNNLFNDVNYIFNKDIFYGICLPMLEDAQAGKAAGITSFDDYANWMAEAEFGPEAALLGRTEYKAPEQNQPFVDEVKEMVEANITQNVVELAQANHDVDFYYYLTPYSVAWWGSQKELGTLERWLAVEKYAIEMMLECDNIHLYSFNNEFDVVSDLNNYRDECHHGDWINSQILGWLYSGTDQLTKENYKDYLAVEKDYYTTFDYEGLLK
ncbi:hypothetical protein [Pseudobutyrivibrio xylanivorans]|uniref:Uncharacterized protein n=1 Tax=Pseudobutyrivibrio xylanivorans TaxID=185007 RepID=A0A1G5S0X6_PSEXY|nr:hypothetical protein [Pseudobutyrivibrio xylanivorans]SCZ79777.1 hypothetical protein SAMN02910350_01965 [Pseudobutyrivibrio xylanivorans]